MISKWWYCMLQGQISS